MGGYDGKPPRGDNSNSNVAKTVDSYRILHGVEKGVETLGDPVSDGSEFMLSPSARA